MTSFRSIIVGFALASCVSLQASFFSKLWKAPAPNENALHYVIIGASEQGLEAARELRRTTRYAKITVIDSDPEIRWSTPSGKKLFAQKTGICSQQEADTLHIAMRLGVDVERIDARNQAIKLINGEEIHFDSLLLAPYATDNVHRLQKYILDDFDAKQTIKRVVIEGGDFEALKLVNAVESCRKFRKHQGKRIEIDITLVVNDDQLARDNLDTYASQKAIDRLKACGVDVRLNSAIESFDVSKESCAVNHVQRIEAVTLSNGEHIEAQLIVKPGIEKQVDLAQQAGIAVDASGIIVRIDLCAAEHMGDHPYGYMIFAVGDITIPAKNILGKVTRDIMANKLEQARVAARNMTIRNIKIYHTLREFYKPQLMIPSVGYGGLCFRGIGAPRIIDSRELSNGSGNHLFCYDSAGLITGLCEVDQQKRLPDYAYKSYGQEQALFERLMPETPEQPDWITRTVLKALRRI